MKSNVGKVHVYSIKTAIHYHLSVSLVGNFMLHFFSGNFNFLVVTIMHVFCLLENFFSLQDLYNVNWKARINYIVKRRRTRRKRRIIIIIIIIIKHSLRVDLPPLPLSPMRLKTHESEAMNQSRRNESLILDNGTEAEAGSDEGNLIVNNSYLQVTIWLSLIW